MGPWPGGPVPLAGVCSWSALIARPCPETIEIVRFWAPARRAGEIEKQGGSVDKKLKLLVLCTVFGGEVPVGLRKFATFPGCKFLFTRSNHAQALIEARCRAGLFAPNFNGWSPSRK